MRLFRQLLNEVRRELGWHESLIELFVVSALVVAQPIIMIANIVRAVFH